LLGQQGPYGQNAQALSMIQQNLTSQPQVKAPSPVQTLQGPKQPTTLAPKASGSTAGGVVDFAKTHIGKYPETAGNNRGSQLDNLEQYVGMRGEPWCSIFATTAVVHATGNKAARTASVPTLAQWAQAGTHGYQKGILPTSQARPGDLIIRGGAHVAVVVGAAKNGQVTVIEGNANGSGGVSTPRTYSLSKWTGVVRPK
jgi:hypothetical protein